MAFLVLKLQTEAIGNFYVFIFPSRSALLEIMLEERQTQTSPTQTFETVITNCSLRIQHRNVYCISQVLIFFF